MPNIITGQSRRPAVNGQPQILIPKTLTQIRYRGHQRFVRRNGVTHDLKEHIDFVESKYIPSGPYRTVPAGNR